MVPYGLLPLQVRGPPITVLHNLQNSQYLQKFTQILRYQLSRLVLRIRLCGVIWSGQRCKEDVIALIFFCQTSVLIFITTLKEAASVGIIINFYHTHITHLSPGHFNNRTCLIFVNTYTLVKKLLDERSQALVDNTRSVLSLSVRMNFVTRQSSLLFNSFVTYSWIQASHKYLCSTGAQ